MSCMRQHVNDDAGYLDWISRHPDGFVINTYTRTVRCVPEASPGNLHTISRLQPDAKTFTDGAYSKICGGGRDEFVEHAHGLGGSATPRLQHDLSGSHFGCGTALSRVPLNWPWKNRCRVSATTVPTYCHSPVGQPDHARNPTLYLKGLPEDRPW
jgi:hypothetical protein